jgi:hypothetical protein
MAIQHVVLFQFPADLSAEDDRTLRARVAGWPVEIGGFHRLRFGSDLTGARTAGYHYLLLTEFDDEGALRRYGAHPVHRAFVDWVHEKGSTELAFDYHLTAGTALVGD